MEQIKNIIREPVKRNERAELIKFFDGKIENRRGKLKPHSLGFLLSHIPTSDLYYFVSVCRDVLNRNGNTALNKAFWGMLKNKK